MRVAEGAHTGLRPTVQAACSFSSSVEHAGNSLIGHQACTGTDQVNRFRLDSPTRLTSSILPHREAGMIATLPVQQQLYLFAVDAGYHLVQYSASDTVAGGAGGGRVMPGPL